MEHPRCDGRRTNNWTRNPATAHRDGGEPIAMDTQPVLPVGGRDASLIFMSPPRRPIGAGSRPHVCANLRRLRLCGLRVRLLLPHGRGLACEHQQNDRRRAAPLRRGTQFTSIGFAESSLSKVSPASATRTTTPSPRSRSGCSRTTRSATTHRSAWGTTEWGNRRLRSTLGDTPPDEFETVYCAGPEKPSRPMLAPA